MISISLNTPHPTPPLLGRDYVPGTIIYSKIQKLEYLISTYITECSKHELEEIRVKNERLDATIAQFKAEEEAAKRESERLLKEMADMKAETAHLRESVIPGLNRKKAQLEREARAKGIIT